MRDEFFEAKYRSLSDDNNVICPYCKHEFQPESEDYSEDTREHQCSECDKKFYMHQTFSVSHYSKPDCTLNGEEHEWDMVSARTTNYQSCGKCDKWRPMPKPAAVADLQHDSAPEKP